MTDKIEWGAEIPVNGVRPDWLGDTDKIQWKDCRGYWMVYGFVLAADVGWQNITAIKLPADHKYYRRTEASEPVAPPGYVLVKQMSEGEWRNDRTAGSLYWARNQGIIRPEPA